MQLRCVRSGVDDGDDRVEVAARDVVRVPLARPVGRVVVGGEDEAGADRVAGVVDGEDRRTSRGGVAHLRLRTLLDLAGQGERRVHQLLEAEDEHAAGVPQGSDEAGGHRGQRRVERRAVLRREAVPAPVGHRRGPAEIHTRHAAGLGARLAARLAARLGVRRRDLGEGLVVGDQGLTLGEDVVGELDGAGRGRDQVDAGADLTGEVGQAVPVVGRAHVDEGDDDVVLARVALVQGADRVQDRIARGELVVDEDERTVPREEAGVLGQQQMRGGVRVGLLEAARAGHPVDGAPRRVQIRREAQAVGYGVPEARRRLGVSEHDGPPRRVVAEQLAHP